MAEKCRRRFLFLRLRSTIGSWPVRCRTRIVRTRGLNWPSMSAEEPFQHAAATDSAEQNPPTVAQEAQ